MMMIFVLVFNRKLLRCVVSPQVNTRHFWILDSTLWDLDSRYWILDSLSVRLGFRIPIISGIPDSLSWIPESRYLFPGDKMAIDPHLPQWRSINSCFQCLVSGATVRDPVVSVNEGGAHLRFVCNAVRLVM